MDGSTCADSLEEARSSKRLDEGRHPCEQPAQIGIFRTFGVLPGSADTHVAEFFPWFVTPASDFGRDWGVHHYGLAGHREDKAEDDEMSAELEKGGEVSRLPSGELVAPLLDAVVARRSVCLPMNLPNSGQVTDLPEGVVVECMGAIDRGVIGPRDVASAGAASEHLRRVVASQELTVDAALSGDRSLVLKAMLADPVAGSLPFEHITSLTDEMLSTTAHWLPQFK